MRKNCKHPFLRGQMYVCEADRYRRPLTNPKKYAPRQWFKLKNKNKNKKSLLARKSKQKLFANHITRRSPICRPRLKIKNIENNPSFKTAIWQSPYLFLQLYLEELSMLQHSNDPAIFPNHSSQIFGSVGTPPNGIKHPLFPLYMRNYCCSFKSHFLRMGFIPTPAPKHFLTFLSQFATTCLYEYFRIITTKSSH